MRYIIYNQEDNQHFIINFSSGDDCEHWIINTLDLSKHWSFEPYDDTREYNSDNYGFIVY